MSMKPKMAFKGRMDRDDAVWLIWSNKWGCWYRDKSQGYTSDPLQAGLFSKAEAADHYRPDEPRAHRCTEPFPVSALRAQLTDAVAKARADLRAAEQRLELICQRSVAQPPDLSSRDTNNVG